MKTRAIRLLLAGGLALGVAGSFAPPANAAVCHPTFRPYCDAVCAEIPSVCRLFG